MELETEYYFGLNIFQILLFEFRLIPTIIQNSEYGLQVQ